MSFGGVSVLSFSPLLWALLAGALRLGSRISFEDSALLSGPVVLVVVGVWWRWRDRGPISQELVVAGFASLCSIAMYFRTLGGLSSLGSADAGYHADFLHHFLTDDPYVYNQFYLWYALVAIPYRLFGCSLLDSFILAHLYSVWLWGITVFGVAMRWPDHKPDWVRLGCVALAQGVVGLPALFYLQGEGFLPQILGSVVLLGIVAAWSRASTGIACVWLIGGGAVLLRTSYGLHLGDLLCGGAVSILAFRGRSAVSWAGVGVLALGGLVAYYHLAQIAPLEGSIRRFDVTTVVVAVTVASILPFGMSKGGGCHPGFLWGGIAAASLAALGMYSGVKAFPPYYGYKALVTLILISSALLPLSLVGQARCVAGSVTAILLAWGMRGALQGFYLGEGNRELVNREELKVIDRVLEERDSRFGGFLGPRWAGTKFLNSMFGYEISYEQYLRGEVDAEIGKCVFWTADEDRRESLRVRMIQRGGNVDEVIERLMNDPSAEQKRVSERGRRELGILCRK